MAAITVAEKHTKRREEKKNSIQSSSHWAAVSKLFERCKTRNVCENWMFWTLFFSTMQSRVSLGLHNCYFQADCASAKGNNWLCALDNFRLNLRVEPHSPTLYRLLLASQPKKGPKNFSTSTRGWESLLFATTIRVYRKIRTGTEWRERERRRSLFLGYTCGLLRGW